MIELLRIRMLVLWARVLVFVGLPAGGRAQRGLPAPG